METMHFGSEEKAEKRTEGVKEEEERERRTRMRPQPLKLQTQRNDASFFVFIVGVSNSEKILLLFKINNYKTTFLHWSLLILGWWEGNYDHWEFIRLIFERLIWFESNTTTQTALISSTISKSADSVSLDVASFESLREGWRPKE